MLYYAAVLFVIAGIAAIFGFSGVAVGCNGYRAGAVCAHAIRCARDAAHRRLRSKGHVRRAYAARARAARNTEQTNMRRGEHRGVS